MYTKFDQNQFYHQTLLITYKLHFVNLNDDSVNVFVKRSLVHVLYGMNLIEPTYKLMKLGLKKNSLNID